LALAAAIGLEAGEEVQWELLERGELHLLRPATPSPLANGRAKKRSSQSELTRAEPDDATVIK
jgi:hypothetical protein